jgi:hypothetical protein
MQSDPKLMKDEAINAMQPYPNNVSQRGCAAP